MRKLLGTFVILVLLITAIGFYRGWFSVSKDDQPGETNVEIKIDKDKIKQDAQEATRKAKELGSDVENRIGAGGKPAN
jgi:hypothetical protein